MKKEFNPIDKKALDYKEPVANPARQEQRLEDIWGQFPRVTSIPTWVPKTFRDSFAIDTLAGALYFYDFQNNLWRTSTSYFDTYLTGLDSAGNDHTAIEYYWSLPGSGVLNDGFTEVTTTNNTPLTLNPSAFGAIVGGVGLVEARITAVQTAGSGTIGDVASYIRRATYKFDGVTMFLMGAVTDLLTYEDNAAWDATLIIVGDFPVIQVTGEAGKTIKWGIQCTMQQI